MQQNQRSGKSARLYKMMDRILQGIHRKIKMKKENP